VRHINRDIREN